ncbi:MAG: SDR family oxidoreductase, partial [Mesorhizobium sp.]
MTNLTGRSAIVTGGFSGMGFAIATALAEAGANIAVGSYVAPPQAGRTDAAYYPGAEEIERVRAALGAHGTKVH